MSRFVTNHGAPRPPKLYHFVVVRVRIDFNAPPRVGNAARCCKHNHVAQDRLQMAQDVEQGVRGIASGPKLGHNRDVVSCCLLLSGVNI